MRRGIGLRGYAQQDPLNEFRKEAFALYEELGGFIRHQVATTIFRVTVTPNAAAGRRADAPTRPGAAGPHDGAIAGGATTSSAGGAGAGRSQPAGRPPASCRGRGSAAAPAARVSPPARVASRRGQASHPTGAGSAATTLLVRFRPEVQALSRPLRTGAGHGEGPGPGWDWPLPACSVRSSSPATPRSESGNRASGTNSGLRTRSWSWVPPNTTARRRRCSAPASITPSTSITRAVAADVRGDRRQAAADRTTEAGAARAYAMKRGVPDVGDPHRGSGREHARVDRGGRNDPSRPGSAVGGLRVRSDAHPPGPADRPRPGTRGVGVANDHQPNEGHPDSARAEATSTSSVGWASTFLAWRVPPRSHSGPESVGRAAPDESRRSDYKTMQCQ